jgi:hypothetical protein
MNRMFVSPLVGEFLTLHKRRTREAEIDTGLFFGVQTNIVAALEQPNDGLCLKGRQIPWGKRRPYPS